MSVGNLRWKPHRLVEAVNFVVGGFAIDGTCAVWGGAGGGREDVKKAVLPGLATRL